MRPFQFSLLLLLMLPFNLLAQEYFISDSLTATQEKDVEVIQLVQQKQDSLFNASITLRDSLQIQQELDSLRSITQAYDTLKLKRSLDSLQELSLPTESVQVKIDSVQDLLDVSAKGNKEINKLNQQINQPLGEGQQNLQEKVNNSTQLEGVSQDGLSELKEQTGLEVNTQLPELEGINLEGIEGIETSRLDVPELDLGEMEIPEAGLPEFELEGLQDIQSRLGQLGEVSHDAEAYTEDMVKITEGNLGELENSDKLAEEQFLQSERGQAFQQQMGGSQEGTEGLKQLAGRDYAKAEVEEKVYEAAIDHFAGNSEQLKAAQAELNKYKGRFKEVKSVKEMPKGFFRLNPLKDKPWQERVIIGSLWQFGRQEQYLVDFGPTLAWRFTDRLSAGGGGQYRLSISQEHKPWVNSSDRVLGYFVFTDFRFKKGFFARLSFENLQTDVPRFNASRQVETTEQRWVKSLSPGIGKSFSFYKQLKGYTVLQYNFLHRFDQTPYNKALQAKIGFYLLGKDLQRKKKKKEADQPGS